MRIKRQVVVFDAADLTAESSFWAGLQIHLDPYVDDIRIAHDEAMALGARMLKAADDLDAVEGFQVYADPAGHPFCLCWS